VPVAMTDAPCLRAAAATARHAPSSRLDCVAHRVKARRARGGYPFLRPRARAVGERFVEIFDGRMEVVDRCGGEGTHHEAAVKHGLPGVHDDGGAAAQQAADDLDRARGPMRAVIGRDYGAVERAAAVGHDQQRHVGVVEQAGGRGAQESTREGAAPARTARKHVRGDPVRGVQQRRPRRGGRVHGYDLRLQAERLCPVDRLLRRLRRFLLSLSPERVERP
jgi:hypothetical protein